MPAIHLDVLALENLLAGQAHQKELVEIVREQINHFGIDHLVKQVDVFERQPSPAKIFDKSDFGGEMIEHEYLSFRNAVAFVFSSLFHVFQHQGRGSTAHLHNPELGQSAYFLEMAFLGVVWFRLIYAAPAVSLMLKRVFRWPSGELEIGVFARSYATVLITNKLQKVMTIVSF